MPRACTRRVLVENTAEAKNRSHFRRWEGRLFDALVCLCSPIHTVAALHSETQVNRTKRIGLMISAGGLALAMVGVLILQVDPTRMMTAHRIVHRAGLFLMLAGLVVFLVVNTAQRKQWRFPPLTRLTLAAQPAGNAAPLLQTVGAALMAVAITGEFLAALSGFPPRLVLLICAGLPGGLIWFAGALAKVVATASAHRELVRNDDEERHDELGHQRVVARQNSTTE